MGLNILVTTLDHREHPNWDWTRFAGDREVPAIVAGLPGTQQLDDIEWYWRPTDFAAFRAARWPSDNPARWKLLADILEREPEYWVYFSV